jgi:hypothetical protein
MGEGVRGLTSTEGAQKRALFAILLSDAMN